MKLFCERQRTTYNMSDPPEWAKQLMAAQSEMMASQNRFEERQTVIQEEVQKLGEEVKRFDMANKKLQKEVANLKRENGMLKTELCAVKTEQAAQEQYSRSKNVIFYDVPGKSKETHRETKEKVNKILATIGSDNRVVVAHRLNASKANSAIVAVFDSKLYAQEIIQKTKEMKLTTGKLGMEGNSADTKIIAKPHLCKFLEEIRKATADLKTELEWGWVKVITSKMKVELYEGKNQDPVVFNSVQDVDSFRETMIEKGILKRKGPGKHSLTPPKSNNAKERKTADVDN